MKIDDYIKNNKIEVIVKPNSKSNNLSCDEQKQLLKLDIKAPAEDNKANIELIRFLRKLLKKDIKIISGLKNKRKIIQIT